MAGSGNTSSGAGALAWRMGRHHLVDRAPSMHLLRVVGEICGLHAQVMTSAELSIWARVEGISRDAVQDVVWEKRELVKLWAMRGTLHLLPTAELGMWLAAFGTYTHYGNRSDEMEVLAEAVAGALDGRLLTRHELASEVRRRTGSAMLEEWVRESWGTSLKAISFRGLLCFATSDNGRVRFTTPATWVPETAARWDAATALREMTRRFLAAYGPVSAAQFALWWGGTGPTRATRMLAAVDDAREIEVGGETLWALAGDLREIETASQPRAARLLPAFDPWVVGASRTDDAVVDSKHRARVYRAQGWMSPVLLVDGRIVGIWRHTLKTRRVVVELTPFVRLPAGARTELEAEAERLAAFFERDLELTRGS